MKLRPAFDWRQVPLFRLLLFMALGVALHTYQQKLGWNDLSISPTLVLLLLPILLWERIPWRWQYRAWWIPGFCIAMLMLFLGWWRAEQYASQNQATPLEQLQKRWLLVQLEHAPSERAKSQRVFARIQAVADAAGSTPAQAGLLLYLPKNQTGLSVGSRCWVWAQNLQYPPENRNPAGFSYRQYLSRKNIHYQLYMGNTSLIHAAPGSFAWYHPAMLQHEAGHRLKQYMPDAASSAFATALLLGDRSSLPGELVKAYSSSGLIHVLAVSGLHVGIIYVLLQTVLGKIIRRKPAVLLGCLLFCLWAYAAITGLSASVTRASLMCSMLALGKHFHRQSGVYNTLSAAALLLLWYQPNWLLDTGFQLSFAAVAGIVYLQPILLRSVYIPHPWLYKIWELSCVTLSAQLFTLPLTLYYFGQFPNYFLMTNLIVLPAMAPVLGACLLLIVLSPFPMLAAPFGWLLSTFIGWLNQLVQFFEQLPGAVSTGIRLDFASGLLIFALLLCLSWWKTDASAHWRRVSLLLAAVLLGKSLWQQQNDKQQALLVLYDENRKASGAIITGQTAWYWGSTAETAFAPHHPHFTQLGIRKSIHLPDSASKLWRWSGGRLLHLRGKHSVNENLPAADWLLLSNQPSWRDLAPQLGKFKGLLLDSSNSPYYCRKLKQLAAQHQLPIKMVSEDGAIQLSLWNTSTSKYSSTNALGTSSLTAPKSAMPSMPN